MSATTETLTAPAFAATRRRPGLAAATRWELRKLVAQARTRWTLLAPPAAPILIVVVIKGQGRPPKDTLYGRYIHHSGFSVPLLMLGFATQWVLPLLTALVAGDIFASEDQHGTWKTVLTRSTSRSKLFWAKTAVAIVFALVALVVLAAATIAASTLIVGHQPLTGLSGQTISPRSALGLVAASWASMAMPMVAFTCLAL